MWKLYKKQMKHLFIIGITILLFAGLLVANEINKSAEKIQSVEMKSLSPDSIITAFTFLLAALTIMATLFGIFIGYMGYKSSKEYEKEVAKAEIAAKQAEQAAKKAEVTVLQIRSKREKATEEIGKLQRIIDEQIHRSLRKDSLEQNLKAILETTDDLYKPVQDLKTRERLTELRSKAIGSIKKVNPEQTAVYLQEMISLGQDDAIVLHAWPLYY